MSAVSPAKAMWSRQDHSDWVRYWNAVNLQDGNPDKKIEFHWADIFPIRTPTVLRCVIVDPTTISMLCMFISRYYFEAHGLPIVDGACWEQNANVADESV